VEQKVKERKTLSRNELTLGERATTWLSARSVIRQAFSQLLVCDERRGTWCYSLLAAKGLREVFGQ
ncbi:hypothetical protein CEXT_771891, partial [Caerostris extrusa]